MMTDVEQAGTGNETGYTQHRLYKTAVQKMADGDDAGAVEALERLFKLYPEEKDLQSLLLRAQLRATFGGGDYIPVEHAPPKPVLRNLVVILLVVTVVMVVVAALTYGYQNVYLVRVRAEEWEAHIQSLWKEANGRLEAGDLIGARELGEKLRAELGDNPQVEEFLQAVEQREKWEKLYTDCVDAKNRDIVQDALDLDAVQEALDLCDRVPPESGRYGTAQGLIEELQGLADLAAAWRDSEALIDAGDLPGALSILSWIRSQKPDFRQDQVEERLFDLHRTLALQLIGQARGDVARLREATSHLSEALALRPANQDLVDERDLAVGFVAGAEAYDRGDWPSAAAKWELVYAARPDYQEGVLGERLKELYPRAAEQLIAEAKGSVRQLSRAQGYLEQALRFDPGNETLLQEKDLIARYLEGLEAFSSEKWDLAIYTWGPIYAIRPGYQDGVLEENLRLACANSETPDEAQCPP